MATGEWISCVCHSSLTEFVGIVTSSKHCARPLNISAVQKAMDKMLAKHRPMVLYSDDTILRRAMKLMEKYPAQKERFTETHIAATAITHGVKTIVTADSAGFLAIRELDIENPFEALFA
jgi:predicted nucleic acid-binding protein